MHAPKHRELTLEPLTGSTLIVPRPANLLELRLEVAHGLVHEQLLKRPLLDVARFVLFEVVNVLHSAGEDGTLGFLAGAVGHDAAEFVDALVDVPPPPPLDFFLQWRKYGV